MSQLCNSSVYESTVLPVSQQLSMSAAIEEPPNLVETMAPFAGPLVALYLLM